MKAAVLYGKNDIRYEENFEEPKLTKDFLKVRVRACGICGSDVPRVLGDAAHFFPIILGHEFAGEVAEVNEGSKFQVGDHVTVAPLVPCMECEDCKNGNFSLCKKYAFIGSRLNGGMAEFVVAPERNVMKIDNDIPFIQGATFEPSTVAIHAIKLAKMEPNKTVAVIGCGIIGNFLLEWAKIYGAKKVVAIGRSDEGLKAAKKLGIDAVLNNKDEDFKEKVSEVTDGRGFDFVFESAGNGAAMIQALDIAGNKATVCFVGTPKNKMELTIKEWENINRKELMVTGSWMSYSNPFPGTEWTETADRFKDGKLTLIPEMIHETYPLSKVKEAFDNFKEPGKVKGRIIFTID